MNDTQRALMAQNMHMGPDEQYKKDFHFMYTRDTEVFLHRLFMYHNNQPANVWAIGGVSAEKIDSLFKKKFADIATESIVHRAISNSALEIPEADEDVESKEKPLALIYRLKKDLY